mmetsp:Transcript_6945/g.22001  ORF Transcript_6945/g.22001 Transcript_6945/m.22001 type:complete len:299 (+) Transcript_6945:310-1206(+)
MRGRVSPSSSSLSSPSDSSASPSSDRSTCGTSSTSTGLVTAPPSMDTGARLRRPTTASDTRAACRPVKRWSSTLKLRASALGTTSNRTRMCPTSSLVSPVSGDSCSHLGPRPAGHASGVAYMLRNSSRPITFSLFTRPVLGVWMTLSEMGGARASSSSSATSGMRRISYHIGLSVPSMVLDPSCPTCSLPSLYARVAVSPPMLTITLAFALAVASSTGSRCRAWYRYTRTSYGLLFRRPMRGRGMGGLGVRFSGPNSSEKRRKPAWRATLPLRSISPRSWCHSGLWRHPHTSRGLILR